MHVHTTMVPLLCNCCPYPLQLRYYFLCQSDWGAKEVVVVVDSLFALCASIAPLIVAVKSCMMGKNVVAVQDCHM